MAYRAMVATISLVSAATAFGCTGQIEEAPSIAAPPPEEEPTNDNVVEEVEILDPIEVNPPEETPPLLQAQVEDILNRNCGACHGAEGTLQAGLDYIENLDQLIASGRVVPGDAEASLVVSRLVNGSMPPAGSTPRPTDDEITQIVTFVNSLAPIGEGEGVNLGLELTQCDDPIVSFNQVFEQLQADILAADADDRPFLRYVGLTNRLNAGLCSGQLDEDRWALGKLLNSLSTRPGIQPLNAIDEFQVIYRIDLRDYDWDEEVDVGGRNFDDAWEAIIDSSDFAIPFEGDEADVVNRFAETDVPFLYADALVNVAAEGDLYYGIARVPESIDELLADLAIDVEENLDRGLAARAATTQSGISREERVIERHDVNVGGDRVFWQSFEFGPGSNGTDIFINPLEIDPGETEVIYSQPNGLHAYASFDENGDRIAESNLLFDTLQDDFVVRSAVSCMTCHARGLLQVRDEVRDFVELTRRNYDADEYQAVIENYPTIEEMDAIVESDRLLYQDALSSTGVPLDVTDPISDISRRFAGRVTVADVAGDLAVEREQLQQEINLLDAGLRPVVEDGAIEIDRDRFANVFGESLCIMQSFSRNRPSDDFCRNVLD